MESIRDRLSRVWAAFRSAGIADDLTIIEYVARLLLEESGVELHDNQSLLPRLPPERENLDPPGLRTYLRETAQQIQSKDELDRFAQLFDRHVLFRLPTMLPGGRFPTPRHITTLMCQLAQIEPDHRFMDFACGSGGLLINHSSYNYGEIWGIEISPEWAKLARANLLLHGFRSNSYSEPRFHIYDQNALRAFETEVELRSQFDRILVSPPFGEKIDAKLASYTLGQKVGSRSETALTLLALNHLAHFGRAAILVPSGILFSNSEGELTLRTRLVEETTLEAVIALPKDAFQPYSSLQTNLLLFSKRRPDILHTVWFFQLEQDGYPSGRGRDLTVDPPQASDIPFAKWVLLDALDLPELYLSATDNLKIGIKKTEDNTVLLFRGIGAELASVDFYPQISSKPPRPPILLIEAITEERRFCIQVFLDGDQEPSVVENRTQLVEERKSKKTAPDPGTRLLSRPVVQCAVSTSQENQTSTLLKARVLGVAIQSSAIRDRNYDLRAEQYVGKQSEARIAESPPQLLENIYRNQRELAQRIDSLFGLLELPPITNPDHQIPSPLSDLQPFGTLSEEQQTIWKKICEQTASIRDDQADNELTAAHFTFQSVDTVEANSADEVSDTTKLTIELFERMGVILPVYVIDPETEEPIALYRRITRRDQWQLDLEDLGSGETS